MAWAQEIHPGDAVLAIHYFGAMQNDLLSTIRDHGAIGVSDSTHLLFSESAWQESLHESDWVIGSLRKSGPFPDGAFCIGTKATPPKATMAYRKDFWIPRAAALLSRGASASQGFLDDENFLIFREAEETLDGSPAGPHAMSFLSQGLLGFLPLTTQRDVAARHNRYLLELLPTSLIHPAAKNAVSPFFPCVFTTREERDSVRDTLARQRIFLPVHWDTSFMVTPHLLSDRIMSIPCDGRYDETDLAEIVHLMRGAE